MAEQSRDYRTADGADITVGMFVWTNDVTVARVGRFLFDENGAGWFDLIPSGMADGSRMAVRHPSSGVVAGPGVIFRHYTSLGESDYRYLTDAGAMVGPFDSEAAAQAAQAPAPMGAAPWHPAVGAVTRVDYAGGVFVTFERVPAGSDYYSDDQRWYYAVWSDNGAEIEDTGYARTKAEAVLFARDARDSVRTAQLWRAEAPLPVDSVDSEYDAEALPAADDPYWQAGAKDEQGALVRDYPAAGTTEPAPAARPKVSLVKRPKVSLVKLAPAATEPARCLCGAVADRWPHVPVLSLPAEDGLPADYRVEGPSDAQAVEAAEDDVPIYRGALPFTRNNDTSAEQGALYVCDSPSSVNRPDYQTEASLRAPRNGWTSVYDSESDTFACTYPVMTGRVRTYHRVRGYPAAGTTGPGSTA